MFILFKHLKYALITPIIYGLQFSAYASSQNSAVSFTLSPRLCVLGEDERECSGTVTLQWRTSNVLSACLFQDGNTRPLQCWNQQTLGHYTLIPHADKSMRFYLANPDGTVLAEGWFEVLQQQTARKRRRNPWSFY